MNKNHHIEHDKIKKVVSSGSFNSNTTTCVAAGRIGLVLGAGVKHG